MTVWIFFLNMKPFYESRQLRFSCTRCGECCIASGDYYVFLSAQEAEKIRRFLGLSRSWFRRRYLERLETGDMVASSGQDDRCVFLDRDGRCRIYPVRPLQCRTYPFWPEVVHSASAWRAEAERCEGINCGSVVPVDRIRRRVTACLKQP
ncbi:MAG: YkgJ family cysteine cluster protein [Gammaproteobacteria bacterium]